DIIDAANWAIEHHIAAKDKVAIMGGSFGGYSTLAGLAYTPQMFCCGVDIVGPSNWMTLFKSVPEYWKPFMIGWYKVGADPNTDEGRQELWELSPLSRADDIAKPLIVFQGQNDPRVNMKESEQIVSALKHKKIPVAYVLYPDEGHGFLREPNKISYLAITEQFLAKFLGGWYEPVGENEFNDSSYKILEGKRYLTIRAK
ncbi:MAG: prolyl oligopeptidase family serine peptidase, partial [Alphaproteobacteria bacterium]|nr:prolyl oligopeptidase family serine peptidase [Alphaproteobacteria bacterium]